MDRPWTARSAAELAPLWLPGLDGLLLAPPEALDQQPMPQPSVAHGQLVLPELVHHGANNARPGEDHLGPLGLQPDDRVTLPQAQRALGGP
jgi:hypothetical protein